eukprot:5254680-Pyramimonas_sp.AAC.1
MAPPQAQRLPSRGGGHPVFPGAAEPANAHAGQAGLHERGIGHFGRWTQQLLRGSFSPAS